MEARLNTAKRLVSNVNDMLSDSPGDWTSYKPTVQSAMDILDQVRFFWNPRRLQEQIWFLQIIQDFAFQDADNGYPEDVAQWCQSNWLRILQDHPDHVEILSGLGHNWLQRAQKELAIIHQEESDEGSSGGSSNWNQWTHTAEQLESAAHVEARLYLQPAVDFFSSAVQSAESNGSLTGDLLTSTAEAYMSLGNVSAAPANIENMEEAIRYLRRAREIPGYVLYEHFEQYIEDYGRYVP